MKRNGFSLIEVLIVLGIIGTLAIFSATRPQSSQKDFDRFYRRFSSFSKKIRNQALLDGKTYRMVFLLSEDEPPQAWVEKAKEKSFLLGDEKESREAFSQILKDFKNKESGKKPKKEDEEKKAFRKVSKFNFSKLQMPRNLKIKQIEISGIDYEIDEGVVAFHYFPHGMVEETSIQFVDSSDSHKATLITESISGQIFKVTGHKRLKDLQERR